MILSLIFATSSSVTMVLFRMTVALSGAMAEEFHGSIRPPTPVVNLLGLGHNRFLLDPCLTQPFYPLII